MDWNNINRDRDTSGLGPIEYDQTKVPALIRKHADNVRTKTYGQEVREAQARNAELAGLIASEAVDISDETKGRQDKVESQFNAVQQEMTDKDVISAPEIIAARNGFDTLDERLTTSERETNERFSQMVSVNVKDFKETGDVDDTLAVNRALDFVSKNGGGKVFIDGDVTLSDTIHVLPKTELYSSSKKSKILFTNISVPVLSFHEDSKAYDLNIEVPSNYASSSLLFESKNLNFNEKVDAYNVNVTKDYSSNKSIGYHLLADSTVGKGAIWNVSVKDCDFRGFTKISKLETIGTGWINGNQFQNIIGMQFESAVEVVKSSESLGIDLNTYSNFILQVSGTTREIFKDTNSTNTYTNFTIFDYKHFENATMGYAPNLINQNMFIENDQTLISTKLYDNKYIKVGSFRKVSSNSDFVVLKIKSPKIDAEVTLYGNGNNLLSSNIKNFGSIKLNNNNLKFYYVINSNGYVDLYYKAVGLNVDVNVVITNKIGFINDYYENVFDLIPDGIEVTNVNINNILQPLNLIKRTSNNITLPNLTPTKIIFDSNVVNSNDITNDGSADFTINKSGIYELKATLIFTSNETGYRSIGFYKNTNRFDPSLQVNAVQGGMTILTVSKNITVNAGDKVSVYGIQSSGIGLAVLSQSEFSITMVRDSVN